MPLEKIEKSEICFAGVGYEGSLAQVWITE
jgi:hypothetical protein